MIDLEIYSDKLAGSSIRVIRKAEQEAIRRNHRQVIPEHLMAVIARSGTSLFSEVLAKSDRSPQTAAQQIEAKLAKHRDKNQAAGMSEEMRWFMQNSLIQAHKQNRRLIEPEDFLNVYFARKPGLVGRLRAVLGMKEM